METISGEENTLFVSIKVEVSKSQYAMYDDIGRATVNIELDPEIWIHLGDFVDPMISEAKLDMEARLVSKLLKNEEESDQDHDDGEDSL